MITFKALLLELLILANYYWYRTQSATVVFRIGALLSSKSVLQEFEKIANVTIDFNNSTKLKFEPFSELMSSNAIKSTGQVCDFLAKSKGRLCALLVSHPPNMPHHSPLSVSFTAAVFHLPTLGITARQSDFSDKTTHRFFIRTITPYSQEANVFIALIHHFEWTQVNVIYTNDHEGRTMLSLLQRTEKRFQIHGRVALTDDDEDIARQLEELSRGQTRVMILYVRTEIAAKVYNASRDLNMLDRNWAWLVTELALKADNVPGGVLGVKLPRAQEEEQMRDALNILKKGIKRAYPFLSRSNELVLKSCDKPIRVYNPTMDTLLNNLMNVTLEAGVTGRVSFNSYGDREQANFLIVNKRANGDIVTVGNYNKSALLKEVPSETKDDKRLNVSLKNIYWPPGDYQIEVSKEVCVSTTAHGSCGKKDRVKELKAPKSFKKRAFLRVVTKESTPFVYKRPLTDDNPCQEIPDPNTPRGEVECTHRAPNSNETKTYCCYGYCIDLLRRLADQSKVTSTLRTANDFRYKLHLVGDGDIGHEIMDKDGKKRWTGIVDELTSQKADLSVAPMTITPERADRIEFTKPFKYTGLAILVKRESNPKSNLASFLQPFTNTLWVLVFLSVNVVALVLYLLDRFSPFGRYKFARGADSEEDALNLSSAMWFAWGVLLNSGIGEGTPRSFSARVLGMVWAGFATIIVASYTANLAAFLVLDRPKALISGIDDPRLRNPSHKDFKFATIAGSQVEEYFKSQVEYDTMLRLMAQNVYTKAEDAIAAVKKGTLKAFIWESARLEFEAASECDLKTAGEIFGRTGYGLAMRKDFPWVHDMSQAVLQFHERGVMEDLDSEWIHVKATNCPQTDTSAATLGLTNMADVFIMVAAGIVAGVFLIFIEMAYKKRTGLKEKELELARNAADRWRGNIEKRKIIRKTRAAEQLEKEMPFIGSSGVRRSMPPFRYPSPPPLPIHRPVHRDCKRTVHLTNQNGIFAEQPLGPV